MLGGDFSRSTAWCFLTFAFARVAYTLMVNFHATFPGTADAAAFVALMMPIVSISRFLLDGAVLLAADRLRSLGSRPWAIPAATLALAFGAVLFTCAANGWVGGMPLFAVGVVLCAAGYELTLLLWHEFFAGLPFETVKRLIVWKIGFDALCSFLVFAPNDVSFLTGLVLPIMGGAGLWFLRLGKDAMAERGSLAGSADQERAPDGRKPDFVDGTHGDRRSQKPWLSLSCRNILPLAAGVFLLSMGFAFAQTAFQNTITPSEEIPIGPWAEIMGRFAALVVMVSALKLLHYARFELFFKLAALISIAGFLFLFLPFSGSLLCFKTFVVVAAFVVEYAVVLTTVYVAGYTLAPPIKVIAGGQFVMRAGGLVSMLAGLGFAPLFNATASESAASFLPYVAAIEVLLLALAGMWLIREQTMGRFLWGRGSAEVERSSVEGGDSTARIARMSADFGLTAREQEILALLVEGRSIPYIKETLYISANTAKTHVRHIYQKTSVHDRQELIDLFQTI